MKIYCSLAAILVSGLLSIYSVNQQDNIIGTWKGTSICQVKNSPCHDETAVYHAIKSEGNTYHFQMNKMVNNKEEEMGETVFTYDTNNKTLDGVTTSPKGKGLWHFVVKGNTMHGTLTVENVLYRVIHLHKD
jgi:hypothetical protein